MPSKMELRKLAQAAVAGLPTVAVPGFWGTDPDGQHIRKIEPQRLVRFNRATILPKLPTFAPYCKAPPSQDEWKEIASCS